MAAPEFVLPNDFDARDYQIPVMRYLDKGGKRCVCVWHRRAGKDLCFAHQTCKLAHRRRGMYWHIFPTAEQGRKAVWEGFTKTGQRIMEQVFPRQIRKSPREFLPKAEMVVELKCGSIWRLLGSDKIEVVGAGPVGVVFSEYAVAKPSAWNMIRPMLRENDGWAAFITTPRGNNHAKKLFDMAKADPSWYCDLKTLYDTRAYDPEATIAAERAEGMPEELIRQEYLCDWTAALVGSVYGDLVPAAIDFEHEIDGVFTTWDLGFTDATAIWFWRINDRGSIDVIDHYDDHGKPLSHYFDVLESKGYHYVKHWLPHDARARTLSSGVSVLDQFLERFHSNGVAIGPALSLLDGIQAARWLLQQPMRLHTRCADGIDALRAYHYAWDENTKAYSPRPEHDWSSHSADAWRYTALVVKVTELIQRKPPPVPPPRVPPVDRSFSLDQLYEARDMANSRRRI